MTFAIDLNSGSVTITGTLPGLPPTLTFSVECYSEFDDAGGRDLLFVSRESSDGRGYVLAIQLVGAS